MPESGPAPLAGVATRFRPDHDHTNRGGLSRAALAILLDVTHHEYAALAVASGYHAEHEPLGPDRADVARG
jgi:hypothetical protein